MTGTDGQRAVTRRPRIEDVAVHSALNDGTAVCLRTITPDDAPLIRDGIARLSAESRYLRFFSPAPVLPDRSDEHTSELQSLMRLSYAVFRLKNNTNVRNI